MRIIFCCIFIAYSNFSSAQSISNNSVNPISYIFHSPINKVKKSIVKSLSDYQFQSPRKNKINIGFSLDTLGESHVWPDAEKIFLKSGNENDVFLRMGDYHLSKVYYNSKGQEPLKFTADYHFHLTKINEEKTRVEVKAVYYTVLTGYALLPSPQMCGFGRSAITKELPITSVEEYELLMQIGKELNERNMPPIIIPKKVCVTRTGKIKRLA